MKQMLLLILAVCFTASVFGQYAETYRIKAEQGNADAQYCLASCYYKGEGVSVNKVKAVEWYSEAAKQGHTAAQNALKNLIK